MQISSSPLSSIASSPAHPARPPAELPRLDFTSVLQGLMDSWTKAQGSVEAKAAQLPKPIGDLLSLQRAASTLQLQCECAARVADSGGATIRRMQQLGGQ